MDKIAVLDFGGQYAHLIANRIRRLGVYSEILDGCVSDKDLLGYKGIILSGGPSSVREDKALKCDIGIFELGVPVLGICYGHQVIAHSLGGHVEQGKVREYGRATAKFLCKDGIFEGLNDNEDVWMSHFDQVVKEPSGFEICASTEHCAIAAMADKDRGIYSTQFHPEVTHTPNGKMILENFVELTGAKREWNIDSYIEDVSGDILKKVGNKKVFLLVSGGVDSTVAFLLLSKALGADRVYGLFVDTGFMRMNERKEVEEALKRVGVTNLHVKDASDEYFSALSGVFDPEKKREIIGNLFIDIQKRVSDELNLNEEEWIIAQGTIYPDTIETGGTKHADKIKTHHNRVERMQKLIEKGLVIEPLAQLYKDEVRLVGERLGLNEDLIWRHPFPGPALAVRCLCADKEYLPENVQALEEEINKITGEFRLKAKILPVRSVGVQGDERTYKNPVVVYGKPDSWDHLSILSTQLTNQFAEINRVILGLEPSEMDGVGIHNLGLVKERIISLQEADKVVMDFIKEAGIDRDIWQFPTVFIPVNFGGSGDSVVLRPVQSEEAMTANFYQMDFDKLNELVKRLKSLRGISGIFYDITNKPPGTIEWE